MTADTITSGPVPTADEQARWDAFRVIAIAQARREHAHEWSGVAASVGTGLAVVAAAITGVMTLPMMTVIITGGLVILAAAAIGFGAWLIDRDRDRTPLFQASDAAPAPGRCSCGARKACTPDAELKPMPGGPGPAPAEVPFTAEVERSAALERAAKLLPAGFDPKVDSLVDGIPAVLDGAL